MSEQTENVYRKTVKTAGEETKKVNTFRYLLTVVPDNEVMDMEKRFLRNKM